MPKSSDVRIYLDLEYCYPGMTAESGRPSPEQLRQVVQIAAIRYDNTTGTELGALNVLTKPTYEHTLPDFFTELTGISQSELDAAGVSFIEGLAQLVEFCGHDEVFVFDADWGVLQQNCTYIDYAFPFESRPFTRIKPKLADWGVDTTKFSSGSLYKAAGLDMDGHIHNALHDVRSMAAAVHVLQQKSGN